MTEEEAIATIVEQVSGQFGLVARLQAGSGIDRDAAAKVMLALDMLSELWKGQSTVPKEAIRAMVGVVQTIQATSAQNLGIADDVEALAEEVHIRLERIFFTRPMSEEEAIAVVRAQLGGMGSFMLTLHQSGVLNVRQVEDVQTALDTLRRAWAARSHVPKSAVGPMLDAREAIMTEAQRDPRIESELIAVAHDIGERIQRCFM